MEAIQLKISLGADHAGYAMKEAVKAHLLQKGHEVIDYGTTSEEVSVDYPDWGMIAASSVVRKEADRGIVICGTGIGMSIVANKVKGIRATLCHNHYTAEMSRKHNDSNVLVMGSRVTSLKMALEITDIWLDTNFESGKHKTRIEKISNIEKTCGLVESAYLSKNEPIGRTFLLEHPLIQHKLVLLRNKNTTTKSFREAVQEISTLMVYPVTTSLPLGNVEIETPIEKTVAHPIQGKKLAIIAILRAGLGMIDGMLKVMPNAKVGHIGLYRDPKSLKPVDYYIKLPEDLSEREVLLVDPMLATGGSAVAAVEHLKAEGAQSIKLVSLLAAPEGIDFLHSHHPDVDIYVAAIDKCLDKNGYIVPGLGDAGDRFFGTN